MNAVGLLVLRGLLYQGQITSQSRWQCAVANGKEIYCEGDGVTAFCLKKPTKNKVLEAQRKLHYLPHNRDLRKVNDTLLLFKRGRGAAGSDGAPLPKNKFYLSQLSFAQFSSPHDQNI